MKLEIFSLLFMLTTANACFAQFKNSNNPNDVHFKGKVDSAIVTYYSIEVAGVREFNDRSIYLYNAKGLLIEERNSEYQTPDSRYFKTTYSYDDKGNYSQVLDYNLSGKIKGKELYSYDQVKRLIEIRNVRNITGTMLLDKAGNILEYVNYQDTYPTSFSTVRYKIAVKGFVLKAIKHGLTHPTCKR